MSESVNATIEVLDGCLEEQQFNYDRVSERIQDIVNLGWEVRNFNPDEPIEGLEDIRGKLEQMSYHLDSNFDTLKSVMGEHDQLYQEMQDAARNLLHNILENLAYPGDDSINNLEGTVTNTPVLELAYKLETVLEQDVTNPFKNGSENDDLVLLNAIFGGLLFIESYVNGLLSEGDMYGPEKLQQIVEDFHGDVERWRNGEEEEMDDVNWEDEDEGGEEEEDKDWDVVDEYEEEEQGGGEEEEEEQGDGEEGNGDDQGEYQEEEYQEE